MPLPIWPSTVPHEPMVGSWKMTQLARPSVDSEFDGGNVIKRSRPGDSIPEIEFKIAMTREEWAELYEWMIADCSNCTSRFAMDVLLKDAMEERVVGFPPEFQPSAENYGPYVSVTMRLRVYWSVP